MVDSFSKLLSRGLDGSPKGSFGSMNLFSTVSLNDGVSKNIVWKQDMVCWHGYLPGRILDNSAHLKEYKQGGEKGGKIYRVSIERAAE